MTLETVKKCAQTYWRLTLLAGLIVFASIVFYTAFAPRVHPLRFVMLDIGQGDALYIESPTGKHIIFDGGPGSALLPQLSRQMPLFDRHIDLIVVTNPDKDHFEGFIPLIKKYKVDAEMESGVPAPENSLWNELERQLKNHNIPQFVARAGQRIEIGGGAYIDILFPDRDVSGLSHNNGSIVAKLVYGKTSVMLTGDSPQLIEHYLIEKDPDVLASSILKVGHHGSRSATSDEFVKAVSPQVAVISAEKNNTYGHPHKETIDTLNKEKVSYLVTMNEGAIVYESDGLKFVRK